MVYHFFDHCVTVHHFGCHGKVNYFWRTIRTANLRNFYGYVRHFAFCAKANLRQSYVFRPKIAQ